MIETFRPSLFVRFALAFCVAPLAPALLETWLVSGLNTDVFVVVAGILYAIQLAIGVPGYLLLREYGHSGLASHMLVGFASVAASVLLLALRSCLVDTCLAEGLYHSTSFGGLGLLMGAGFWLVARPDRHH